MADTKISALPASTVPLAGTEVLPIVQSGSTKQVSVANLTAGRALSATQMTLTTGNLIVANGQGVDFSATPGAGTSELLADYEEGTWTPTDASGAGLSITVTQANYTKVGNLVTAQFYITYPANVNVGGAAITLPFTPKNIFQQIAIVYTTSVVRLGAVNTGGGGGLFFYDGSAAPVANSALGGTFIICNFVYLT